MKNRLLVILAILTILTLCILLASCEAGIRTAKYDFEMGTEFDLEPSSSGEWFGGAMDITTTCVSGRDYYKSSSSFEPARAYIILPDGTECLASAERQPAETQVNVKKGDTFNAGVWVSLPAKYVPGVYDVRVECNGSEKLFEDVRFNTPYKDGVEYVSSDKSITAERVSFSVANRYAMGKTDIGGDLKIVAVADNPKSLGVLTGGYGQDGINIEGYDDEFFENNYILIIYKNSINTAFYYEALLAGASDDAVDVALCMKHFPKTEDGGQLGQFMRIMLLEVPVKYSGQKVRLNYSCPTKYQSGEDIEIHTAKYDFNMDTDIYLEPEYGGKTCYAKINVDTVCVSGRDRYLIKNPYEYDKTSVYFVMPDGEEVRAWQIAGTDSPGLNTVKGDSFVTELYVQIPVGYVPGVCSVRAEYSGSVKIFENVVLMEKAVEYQTMLYEIQAEVGSFERADELGRGYGDAKYPANIFVVTQPSEQLTQIAMGHGGGNADIEKYTAEFFRDNFVIMVYTETGSTGYAFETKLISADTECVAINTAMVDFPRAGSAVGWMQERHAMLVEVPVKYSGQRIELGYSVPLSSVNDN